MKNLICVWVRRHSKMAMIVMVIMIIARIIEIIIEIMKSL